MGSCRLPAALMAVTDGAQFGAFRWTEASGAVAVAPGMQSLGTLLSADGSVLAVRQPCTASCSLNERERAVGSPGVGAERSSAEPLTQKKLQLSGTAGLLLEK